MDEQQTQKPSKMTPEARARISASKKGIPLTAEHKRKISETLRGRPVPPEMRARISATMMGRKRGPRSPETRAKISASNKRTRALKAAGLITARGPKPQYPVLPEALARVAAHVDAQIAEMGRVLGVDLGIPGSDKTMVTTIETGDQLTRDQGGTVL